MTKKIIRMGDELDPEYLARLTEEYERAREFAESAMRRADELKSQLSKFVEQYGQEDEKGNLWLPAGVSELKRERRVSRKLNAVSAEIWAKNNNLWDVVSEVVEQVSEDKLLNLAWETTKYADDIADLYQEKITWAFKVIENKRTGE